MDSIQESVRRLFSRLQAGALAVDAGLLQDGWEMTLPSGEPVTRSVLQSEAQALIELGPDAVPSLLPWVMDENLALRYVATFALQQITGETPYLSHFDQADRDHNRARAVDVWRRWYESREASAADIR